MIRKTMTLTSIIGICIPLLISVAGANNYSLANGKYSWKSSGIDPRDGKPYKRNSTVTVTRDGNKVTIEYYKAQIVGTLEGNKFSGYVSERPGDYADLQGTLTSNNHMEGILNGKSRGVAYKESWTLEYIGEK
jgi:hypothetical protein